MSFFAREAGPIAIRGPGLSLEGSLSTPNICRGVVVFAQESPSHRGRPRNQIAAEQFHSAGLATLLVDLLTPFERLEHDKVFDIALLARRLLGTLEWVDHQQLFRDLPLGIFGAGTGTAAALWTTAQLGDRISAIVSRSGRPDLALARLRAVSAPTLLIVGDLDTGLRELNRQALARLPHGKLTVIPEIDDLFVKPAVLFEVARLARDWFGRYLIHGRDARFVA